MPTVPSARTAPSAATPALVSPEEAARPGIARSRSLEAIGESTSQTIDAGVKQVLAFELDEIRKRHARESSTAEAEIQNALNSLTAEFERDQHDFNTIAQDYTDLASNAVNEVLGGIQDQDVLDVVQARTRPTLERHINGQALRAAGLELQARNVALTSDMSSKAIAYSMEKTPDGLSLIRHDVDIIIGMAIQNGTISAAEGTTLVEGWIEAATAASASAHIQADPLRALLALQDPTSERYMGMNPQTRQDRIRAAINEIDSRERRDIRNQAVLDREGMGEIFDRLNQDNHPLNVDGPFEGGTAINSLSDNPKYARLPFTFRAKVKALLEKKARGGDLNEINYNVLHGVYRGIISGRITDEKQFLGDLGEGIPYRDYTNMINLMDGLNDTRPENRALREGWKQFQTRALAAINPGKGIASMGDSVSVAKYQQWFSETQARYLAGKANPEITNKLDMFNDQSPHWIGDHILQFRTSVQQKANAIELDLGLTGPGGGTEVLQEEIGRITDDLSGVSRGDQTSQAGTGGLSTSAQRLASAHFTPAQIASAEAAVVAGRSEGSIFRTPDLLEGLDSNERTVLSLMKLDPGGELLKGVNAQRKAGGLPPIGMTENLKAFIKKGGAFPSDHPFFGGTPEALKFGTDVAGG